MTEHPIKALGQMLRQSAKPPKMPSREELLAQGRRAFIGEPVLNINSLDPNDARGVEDVIDFDRERAKRDGELIEVNSADPEGA